MPSQSHKHGPKGQSTSNPQEQAILDRARPDASAFEVAGCPPPITPEEFKAIIESIRTDKKFLENSEKRIGRNGNRDRKKKIGEAKTELDRAENEIISPIADAIYEDIITIRASHSDIIGVLNLMTDPYYQLLLVNGGVAKEVSINSSFDEINNCWRALSASLSGDRKIGNQTLEGEAHRIINGYRDDLIKDPQMLEQTRASYRPDPEAKAKKIYEWVAAEQAARAAGQGANTNNNANGGPGQGASTGQGTTNPNDDEVSRMNPTELQGLKQLIDDISSVDFNQIANANEAFA